MQVLIVLLLANASWARDFSNKVEVHGQVVQLTRKIVKTLSDTKTELSEISIECSGEKVRSQKDLLKCAERFSGIMLRIVRHT